MNQNTIELKLIKSSGSKLKTWLNTIVFITIGVNLFNPSISVGHNQSLHLPQQVITIKKKYLKKYYFNHYDPRQPV
jgi:hypothetical protein